MVLCVVVLDLDKGFAPPCLCGGVFLRGLGDLLAEHSPLSSGWALAVVVAVLLLVTLALTLGIVTGLLNCIPNIGLARPRFSIHSL